MVQWLNESIVHPLENIYISPLELCNLACLYCYTNKTKAILTNDQILDFVKSYSAVIHKSYFLNLKSIIFCGGEVFTLKNFPQLINSVTSQGIFCSVITNGTVDKLDEIIEPHNCQLIVSFDGPEKIHDQNRGLGNFQKSSDFVQKALKLGFPIEIFYLITKDSYPYKDSFPKDFYSSFQNPVSSFSFTYLVDRLGSLTSDQIKDIRQNYPCYPAKNFGCNMFSLQSNSHFYGCCESARPIGKLTDNLDDVVKKYINILQNHPLCSDPTFACGFQKELKLLTNAK
ncbi:radical SAM protein [Candidatus Shapirobacteria bacterium]|nr:radical SAM protein [Candidatus Shapirobacteria bacterium]